jgi:hypothetical protein
MLGREVRTPLELLFGCRAEVFVSYGDYVAGLRTRLQVAHEICQRYLARTAKRRKDIYVGLDMASVCHDLKLLWDHPY